MKFFTRKVLSKFSDKQIQEFISEKESILITKNLTLRYRIEDNFCFMQKWDRFDGTFISTEVFYLPESTITPILGEVLAFDSTTLTKTAIIVGADFNFQSLVSDFVDYSIQGVFETGEPISVHTSMLVDAYNICENDVKTDLLGLNRIEPALDTSTLEREGAATLASGFATMERNLTLNERFYSEIKKCLIFAFVKEQHKAVLKVFDTVIGTYTILTVQTPYIGKAALIMPVSNLDYPDFTGELVEFSISECVSSFLPQEAKNNTLDYSFNEQLDTLREVLSGTMSLEAIYDHLSPNVKVYKESLLIASTRECAIKHLEKERRDITNSADFVIVHLAHMDRITLEYYDEEEYINAIYDDEKKTYLDGWRKFLKEHGDKALDNFTFLKGANGYFKYEDKNCLTIFDDDEDTTLGIVMMEMSQKGEITELNFSCAPIFFTSFIHSKNSFLARNILPSEPTCVSYNKLQKSNFQSVKMMFEVLFERVGKEHHIIEQDLMEAESEIAVFVHSVFEALKKYALADYSKIEDAISTSHKDPHIIRALDTKSRTLYMPFVLPFAAEYFFNKGEKLSRSMKNLYKLDAMKEADNIVDFAIDHIGEYPFGGELTEVHVTFLNLLGMLPYQKMTSDEAFEHIFYCLFLFGFTLSFM